MKKIIITIIVIAVIVFGGYFFFKKSQPAMPVPEASNNQRAAVQPLAEEKVVTYANAGYSPASLKIKKGETVVFRNQSSRPMWTASATHPTHRAYPTTGGCLGSTFDSCKGIQPGNDWSFKFDIIGAWKYHNHLNPSDNGTIIVE